MPPQVRHMPALLRPKEATNDALQPGVIWADAAAHCRPHRGSAQRAAWVGTASIRGSTEMTGSIATPVAPVPSNGPSTAAAIVAAASFSLMGLFVAVTSLALSGVAQQHLPVAATWPWPSSSRPSGRSSSAPVRSASWQRSPSSTGVGRESGLRCVVRETGTLLATAVGVMLVVGGGWETRPTSRTVSGSPPPSPLPRRRGPEAPRRLTHRVVGLRGPGRPCSAQPLR